MKREDEGGDCEFEFCVSKLRLKPIAFGSRKTAGNKKHFNSHPGEALAASWSIIKNRHFLWGRPFTLMTDCRALIWLMSYKGHNHAVKRLQLELLGYWFSIANIPGRMLEDANYFSRLGEDIHIDPLLKEYLGFARQSYVESPPASDPLNDQNMPGRRSKRSTKLNELDDSETQVNFARVEWETSDEIDLTPPSNQYSRRYSNVPIDICNTGLVQAKSDMNFSYITETATRLSKFNWCLNQPGHGHFIEASQRMALQFEPTIVCDTDQSCRNTMQSRFSAPFIFDNLSKMDHFCSRNKLPSIQGYYAHCAMPPTTTEGILDLKQQESIINSLKKRASLEMIIFEMAWKIPSTQYCAFKLRLQNEGWQLREKAISSSADFSDRISVQVDILIGLSANYYSAKALGATTTFLSPTPAVPNGISPKLIVDFNNEKYALPYIGEMFTVEESPPTEKTRLPVVQYTIWQKELHQVMPIPALKLTRLTPQHPFRL